MEIKIVKAYKSSLLEQMNALLPQLDQSAKPLTEKELRTLIGSANTFLLAAFEGDQLIGCLTLAWYEKPTGMKAWIEDVIVAEIARGKGVGKLLTLEAIQLAKKVGAQSVNLTSRPSRDAANYLYQKLGFVQYETNVYKYVI